AFTGIERVGGSIVVSQQQIDRGRIKRIGIELPQTDDGDLFGQDDVQRIIERDRAQRHIELCSRWLIVNGETHAVDEAWHRRVRVVAPYIAVRAGLDGDRRQLDLSAALDVPALLACGADAGRGCDVLLTAEV